MTQEKIKEFKLLLDKIKPAVESCASNISHSAAQDKNSIFIRNYIECCILVDKLVVTE